LRADRRFLLLHLPGQRKYQMRFAYAVGFKCVAAYGGKHKTFTYAIEAAEVQA
jgi:hypothetical protein